jgi:hypothetical protein
MNKRRAINFAAIRHAMANFELSPKVEPNETIELPRAFFPDGHRGVLDLKRQLVSGNRGMGKSFWTHALLNGELRKHLALTYNLPALAKTDVIVGFNGSEKRGVVAPTTDEITEAFKRGHEPELIWRAVLLRAAHRYGGTGPLPSLTRAINHLARAPQLYTDVLSAADDALVRDNKNLLVVFDALDRLAQDWPGIRQLTKGLLIRAVGLQSFRAIRVKIFMRVDQFADVELFRFPDSSKIRNDHVDLIWHPYELYGLLLFELLRHPEAADELEALAERTQTRRALPTDGRLNTSAIGDEQVALITAIGGEFMGKHKKRGRLYTWVPLHLSDAANTCSPRTFLTAWRTAAEHVPPPSDGRVIDHLGLIEGVRMASTSRLRELLEDYPWIDPALKALRGQFVPIARDDLFALWRSERVPETILRAAVHEPRNAPVGLTDAEDLSTLLAVMESIAVMEERANGKINVPDIFRVEAQILRKGGVAVPRRN